MPAILCEGAFLMIPEQEAALRTPAFQSAYARGVDEGTSTGAVASAIGSCRGAQPTKPWRTPSATMIAVGTPRRRGRSSTIEDLSQACGEGHGASDHDP